MSYFAAVSQQNVRMLEDMSQMTLRLSAGQHMGTYCMLHSWTGGARTLNFSSVNFDPPFKNPAVNPTDYKI